MIFFSCSSPEISYVEIFKIFYIVGPKGDVIYSYNINI